MRILFLSTWFPYPPDNGSKIRAFHLLRALSKSHQVTLVAFQPTNSNHDSQFLISELNISNIYPVREDPFRYVNIPQAFKFGSPIPVAYWSHKLMRETVAEVINSSQWEAVVAVQTQVARYAMEVPGLSQILDIDTSLSYQLHEQRFTQDGHKGRLRNWVSWQKAKQYETRLFRRFPACTVVSSVELNYIKSMVSASECRVEVSPNGVDCQHHRPGLTQPRPKALVYNGAITYSANYDAMQYFLAEIYPLIQRRESDVSLTITGSTSGIELTGLALDESVRLSGYVDDIRIPVSEAAVCVVPIRQGGGTRLKILEAMALGTPVVATSKGAEGIDAVDGEHILLADDEETFADHAVRLMSEPTLRQRLVTNARNLVEERYDWKQIGDRFVALVESVQGSSGL